MPNFLKYGEIKGEVKEPAHRAWIELNSVQYGTQRGAPPSDGTREASSPTVSEITVTKKLDSTSVLLNQEALSGKGVPAIIDFVKGGSVIFRVTMSGTMISSYDFSGSRDHQTQSLTLNFTKIEYKYTPGTPP